MIDPAIAPLVAVARALGSLAAEVVFIGGAIAPLLQTEAPFPRVRPTVDVDGVVASAAYGGVERLHEQLRARGFREQVSARHVHRWLAPDSPPFDLVPIGDHLGGTGNTHDVEVVATAVRHELEHGLTIRHASAAGFLALKWGAFGDRGRRDPLASHDLEDIVALVASRPGVVEEMRTAPPGLRALVAEWSGWLLATEYAEDLLASHLNNATDVGATVNLVRERIAGMAAGIEG